jgi:hypothetical protein
MGASRYRKLRSSIGRPFQTSNVRRHSPRIQQNSPLRCIAPPENLAAGMKKHESFHAPACTSLRESKKHQNQKPLIMKHLNQNSGSAESAISPVRIPLGSLDQHTGRIGAMGSSAGARRRSRWYCLGEYQPWRTEFLMQSREVPRRPAFRFAYSHAGGLAF